MSEQRTPYDGDPYYCAECGSGFGEFIACEEAGCELESKNEAIKRKQLREARAH